MPAWKTRNRIRPVPYRDETVIANSPTFPGGSVSRFAGQLGKTVTFTADQIAG
jgi:hypothetical protein